jgi:hypothetical protein
VSFLVNVKLLGNFRVVSKKFLNIQSALSDSFTARLPGTLGFSPTFFEYGKENRLMAKLHLFIAVGHCFLAKLRTQSIP